MKANIPKFFFSLSTTGTLVKRFYKIAAVEKNATSVIPTQNYFVKLDNKFIKSPNRNVIQIPTYELAILIAHEFNVQDEYIRPYTMPLFGLAKTAVDVDHEEILRNYFIDSIVAYFQNDTICYQTDEGSKLGDLQNELLSPIRKYIENELQIDMKINYGLETRQLDSVDKEKLTNFLKAKNNWTLTAMESLASTMKSTSLAISVINGFLEVEKAIECANIEENYQSSKFGKVEGSHDVQDSLNLLVVSSAKLFNHFSSKL